MTIKAHNKPLKYDSKLKAMTSVLKLFDSSIDVDAVNKRLDADNNKRNNDISGGTLDRRTAKHKEEAQNEAGCQRELSKVAFDAYNH